MRKKRKVVVAVDLECDVLNRLITPDQVHTIFPDDYVISNEAVARLPKWFSDANRLHLVTKVLRKDMTPEDLHKGVWVIMAQSMWNYKRNDRTDLIKTVAEAEQEILRLAGYNSVFSILQDGEFVKTVRVVTIASLVEEHDIKGRWKGETDMEITDTQIIHYCPAPIAYPMKIENQTMDVGNTKAIWKIEGDTLTICSGTERPTDFADGTVETYTRMSS